MPNDMSPENTGVSSDFLRSLGGPTKLPAAEASLQAAKQEFNPTSVSAPIGAAEQLKAAQDFPQPESKAHIPDIRMLQESPGELTLEQQAYMANMGRERMTFPREKLSGGYEYSTFADSLVELGDAEKKRRNLKEEWEKNKPKTEEPDKEIIYPKNLVEAINHENYEKEAARRAFRISVGAGQDNVESVVMMLGHMKEPAPFNAAMEERHFEGGEKSLKSIARYFEGTLPSEVEGLYHRYDEVNSQHYGLFNLLLSAGGSLQGYYDALKQAGETLIDRGRYHASSADMRAAFAKRDPGVTDFLSHSEHTTIAETLPQKEKREEQIRCLDDARYFINLDTDVAQYDIEQPAAEVIILDQLLGHKDDKGNIDIQKLIGKEGKLQLLGQEGLFKSPYSKETLLRLQKEAKKLEGNVIRKKDYDEAVKTFKSAIEKTLESQERHRNIENSRCFARLLFGDLDEKEWVTKVVDSAGKERAVHIPKEILTWYASGDKLSEREEWLSKMIAVVEYREESGKHVGKTVREILNEKISDAEILDLAGSVDNVSKKIREGINSKVNLADFNRGASLIAITSWVEMDKAWQTSGRLGWMFKYKEINGETRRVYDSGGIYKAFDSINLMYFWRRWVSYKAGWKSTTQFFTPASDNFRREVTQHRPDWLPPIEWIHKDKRMSKIYDLLMNGDSEAEMFRARRLVGKKSVKESYSDADISSMINNGEIVPHLEPAIADILREGAWAFETPYKNKDGELICMPMLMPKSLEYINVWKYIVLDKKTGLTMWDEMCAGKNMSDMNFNQVNFEALDRMWVSMSMLTRFARLWIDPYEAEKDPSIQGFFGDASTQDDTELSKRIFLAFRDLPDDYRHLVLEIIPFSIAQYEAKATGLLNATIGTAEKKRALGRWNLNMSKWMRAIKWLPKNILDEKNLYDTKEHPNAEVEIKALANDMLIILEMYKLAHERLSQATYLADKHALDTIFNDQIDAHNDKALDHALDADQGEATLQSGIYAVDMSTTTEDALFAEYFGKR